jgi:hypothetical protein
MAVSKTWLNMDVIEKDKLQWLSGDLPSAQEALFQEQRPLLKQQVHREPKHTILLGDVSPLLAAS